MCEIQQSSLSRPKVNTFTSPVHRQYTHAVPPSRGDVVGPPPGVGGPQDHHAPHQCAVPDLLGPSVFRRTDLCPICGVNCDGHQFGLLRGASR